MHKIKTPQTRGFYFVEERMLLLLGNLLLGCLLRHLLLRCSLLGNLLDCLLCCLLLYHHSSERLAADNSMLRPESISMLIRVFLEKEFQIQTMNTPTTIISLIHHTLNSFLKKDVDNFFIF